MSFFTRHRFDVFASIAHRNFITLCNLLFGMLISLFFLLYFQGNISNFFLVCIKRMKQWSERKTEGERERKKQTFRTHININHSFQSRRNAKKPFFNSHFTVNWIFFSFVYNNILHTKHIPRNATTAQCFLSVCVTGISQPWQGIIWMKIVLFAEKQSINWLLPEMRGKSCPAPQCFACLRFCKSSACHLFTLDVMHLTKSRFFLCVSSFGIVVFSLFILAIECDYICCCCLCALVPAISDRNRKKTTTKTNNNPFKILYSCSHPIKRFYMVYRGAKRAHMTCSVSMYECSFNLQRKTMRHRKIKTHNKYCSNRRKKKKPTVNIQRLLLYVFFRSYLQLLVLFVCWIGCYGRLFIFGCINIYGSCVLHFPFIFFVAAFFSVRMNVSFLNGMAASVKK